MLLITLLVFGSVSDYLGRRRVILAALVVTAGSLLLRGRGPATGASPTGA